jgi:hypothetical protein
VISIDRQEKSGCPSCRGQGECQETDVASRGAAEAVEGRGRRHQAEKDQGYLRVLRV